MSEYTPTTEDVRFAMAGLRMSAERFVTRDSFDRWLASHDAEVRARGEYYEGFEEGIKVGRAEARAGVVAEEPEWAVDSIQYGHVLADGIFIVEHRGVNYSTHQRRIKLGQPESSWVPVKQEGAETDA